MSARAEKDLGDIGLPGPSERKGSDSGLVQTDARSLTAIPCGTGCRKAPLVSTSCMIIYDHLIKRSNYLWHFLI